MKKILGAIAAAMVWGAGCAHNQEKTAQTEVPSSPQASVESGQLGGSGAPAGYQCEVISTGGSGTAGSAMQQSECPAGEASASAVQDNALGGSASAGAAANDERDAEWPPEVLGDTTIGGEDTRDDAIGGSASEDLAIGGSASQNANTGSAANQNDVQGGAASEEDLAIGGSPSEDAAVEGTGTGSADGGGG